MPASSTFLRRAAVGLAVFSSLFAPASFTPPAAASLVITEINSNGTGGDFFELYNAGPTAIDLTGYRWSDYDVRNWATAWSLDAATLSPGEVAVVGAGNNLTSPVPLFGSADANTAFRTSWGLAGTVKMLTWTGNGAGLGSGDGVILFNAAGTVAASTIYRVAPLISATNQDLTTVVLSTFVKSFSPQPSANGQAGVMGGVGATPAGVGTESLVWDPASGAASPTYRNAIAGQWGAFANPNSAATVGSPGLVGVVPEPSSITLAGLGVAVAVCTVRRRRDARTRTS